MFCREEVFDTRGTIVCQNILNEQLQIVELTDLTILLCSELLVTVFIDIVFSITVTLPVTIFINAVIL